MDIVTISYDLDIFYFSYPKNTIVVDVYVYLSQGRHMIDHLIPFSGRSLVS